MYGELDYGFWMLVIINFVIFIFFVFSFVKLKLKIDWWSLGVFFVFIVVLFIEMYGFLFIIYFLFGWLVESY